MAIQQEIGQKGEETAVSYLKKEGYAVLEKNYRFKKSEIDIIAEKQNTIVFVEVKTRTSTRFGNPEDFVDKAKAAKVIEGAENYIEQSEWKQSIRFDIISIIFHGEGYELKHFKDAFY